MDNALAQEVEKKQRSRDLARHLKTTRKLGEMQATLNELKIELEALETGGAPETRVNKVKEKLANVIKGIDQLKESHN